MAGGKHWNESNLPNPETITGAQQKATVAQNNAINHANQINEATEKSSRKLTLESFHVLGFALDPDSIIKKMKLGMDLTLGAYENNDWPPNPWGEEQVFNPVDGIYPSGEYILHVLTKPRIKNMTFQQSFDYTTRFLELRFMRYDPSDELYIAEFTNYGDQEITIDSNIGFLILHIPKE